MEVKLFDSIEEAKRILPNKTPQLVKAFGKNICVIRIDERLQAFENECPHMGESLHRGKLNYLNEIVCPLHSYRFDIQTGEESNRRCGSLKKINVIYTDAIYLGT